MGGTLSVGDVRHTLICLKPAFSSRSLADLTAWKAGYIVKDVFRRAYHNIRVGEAFTKERKSSAAARDGLVDMVLVLVLVLKSHDRVNVYGTGAAKRVVNPGCTKVARSGVAMGMGLGRKVWEVAAACGVRERGGCKVHGCCNEMLAWQASEHDSLGPTVNACELQNSDKPNKGRDVTKHGQCTHRLARITTSAVTSIPIHTTVHPLELPCVAVNPSSQTLPHDRRRRCSPSLRLIASQASTSSGLTTTPPTPPSPAPPTRYRQHIIPQCAPQPIDPLAIV